MHHTHEPLAQDSRSVNVTTASTLLLAGNDRRVSAIISSPPTHPIWIAFSQPASAGHGIALYPLDPPLVLTPDQYGQALSNNIYAISNTSAQDIGITEIFCLCGIRTGKARNH